MQIKSKTEKEIKIGIEINEMEKQRAWVLDFLKCFLQHLLISLNDTGLFQIVYSYFLVKNCINNYYPSKAEGTRPKEIY